MTYRIAINGYGRIGRNILRALYESGQSDRIKIVAINDLGDISSNVHLTKYDSVHGRFAQDIEVTDNTMQINGDTIQFFAERDPSKLPWKDLDIDVVLECTGFFASREKASLHLQAGAKKVLISAPAGNDLPTVVFGVNEKTLKSTDDIVSNASCTTNCLAPLAKVLHQTLGIESGLMVTIHAFTSDQRLTDNYHSDWRRARAATQSMIPTKTGAAAAVGLVLPELRGKLDGYSVRVPTINVSLVDLTFQAKQDVSVKELNEIVKKASQAEMKNILSYCDEPLVSIDFNHNPHSSIFDSEETRKIGNLYKVIAWYDNEWGFSNRMLDTACAMMKAGQ
jgi:glyceraldehyde 3-phosphate dehydrogenase